MPWRILTLSLLLLSALPVQARTATARVERIEAAGMVLQDVVVRLHWPADAVSGELRIDAGRLDAPDLGYRFSELHWQCPLAQAGAGTWRCEGPLRAKGGAPMRLSLEVSAAATDAELARGDARIALARSAATPDVTRIDLTRVPLAWAQALLARAWQAGRLSEGRLDGPIMIETPTDGPLRVDARLALAGAGLESEDGTVAIGDLAARLHVDYRLPAGGNALVAVDGTLDRGDLLFGSTYVALDGAPVRMHVDAMRRGDGGWDVPGLSWDDDDALDVAGSAAFAADGGIEYLDVDAHSRRLAALPARYLSGWLGLAGMTGMALDGGFDADVRVEGGRLVAFDATFDDVDLRDGQERFRIDGLDGTLRHGGVEGVDSELRWRSGRLYGIDFEAIRLPMRSEAGTLRLREPATMALLGGKLRLEGLTLRPPDADAGLRIGFGMSIDGLDLGRLSKALGWPEFSGTLAGHIPSATYADERLDFEGGLSMQAFGGSVEVDELSMERPFGVAPTLSANIALHDLDLLAITEVFDFGSITGRLHGSIDGLRLVDWTATAFDAELHTERKPGVRQRISQRAVQDISSVGDASFVSTLQGRLIGLFDDFGYRRIGIACRLANEVCRMSGLHSADNSFTIVEGAGVPKLQVVGFNRDVDWPTLLERLAAAATGDVAPVVD